MMDEFAGTFDARAAAVHYVDHDTIDTLDNDAYDNLIIEYFGRSEFEKLKHLLRTRNRYEKLDIDFFNNEINDPSVIKCAIRGDGSCLFTFSLTILAFVMNFSMVARLIIWHWVHSVPLFVAYARSGRGSAEFWLNVADDPHYHGLAFCNCDEMTQLIPDPYFMRSRGYEHLRGKYRATDIPWSERKDTALWRGSNTGEIMDNDMSGLPRVKLCEYAAGNSDLIDAGLTGIVQAQAASSDRPVIDLGIYRKDYIPVEQFNRWKFQIDIDGMTSSWPGFFSKLLSRSVVLKIDSIKGWRQWYYDRLTPWIHYVPIRSDFSDLAPIIRFLRNHPQVAEEIADNAATFVGGFTYEKEIDEAVEFMHQIVDHVV